jgi:hypothetical protein
MQNERPDPVGFHIEPCIQKVISGGGSGATVKARAYKYF